MSVPLLPHPHGCDVISCVDDVCDIISCVDDVYDIISCVVDVCVCCAGLTVASALVDVSQQMCVGFKDKSGGLRSRKQQPSAQPSTCI